MRLVLSWCIRCGDGDPAGLRLLLLSYRKINIIVQKISKIISKILRAINVVVSINPLVVGTVDVDSSENVVGLVGSSFIIFACGRDTASGSRVTTATLDCGVILVVRFMSSFSM